jgi:type I restriction-modification system DNA methylase subunit
MNREQARNLIKTTLTSSFDNANYRTLTLNVLNHIDESKKQAMVVPEAFKDHVRSCARLGTYMSPSHELLDILVVNTTGNDKIHRARTALRNFVSHKLNRGDHPKDAALVAFVSPTEKQWRFSYVKMDYETVQKESGKIGVETRLTPARRFSYLVGEGESSHTAQSRFVGLLQDTITDPSLAQIEEAFSVEAVTKEFFTKYAELFEQINKALEKLVEKDETIREEFKAREINTVDFSKKLMGQIVFLYFLQKKGWLGIEKGKDWGTGPHDFLRRLEKGEYGDYENYFNDLLEPLFYDTLATDRGHEAWDKRFNCRIPFLNGGLFEPLSDYNWKKADIILSNKLFTNNEILEEGITGTGVLDVFDRYNFTVNESEPLEKEVAIDPEMLGKVFENLIEENRRKGLGAYYTPREIVHYMCQESLINYVDTAINKDDELVSRADIETYVQLGEQISHYEAVETQYRVKMAKSIERHARLIDKKLEQITVCDPAVGSGAFPVGMMTEIVRARMALTPYFNDINERTPYNFKRHAIQKCLYGVDIDPGAVEIAKLRLWLSLVVDEDDVKQIKPLPNLDYKIVVGDSLMGFPFKSQRVQRIEKLKADYFDETDHDKKEQLKRAIDAELYQAFARSKGSLGYEVSFDFHIYFSEVFSANNGFDVMIANPPYVSVEKFARTALQTEWKRRFKTYAARGDIYCFFYEQGLNLLRSGGLLTFISSNKFQRTGYGKGLRQLLAAQQIHTLIDFCELPVFVAATDPMIVIAVKAAAVAESEFPVLVVKDETEFSSLSQSVASRASRYKPEQLKAEGWSLEGGDGFTLLNKIREKGIQLGTYVNGKFYYGIKTGLNKAFVIDRDTRDYLIRIAPKSADLIRPWIRGKDVNRWTHEIAEFYVIVVRYGFHKELGRYPAILRHLSKFEVALKARGQCKTSRGGGSEGQHHWLEWDNNPSLEYVSVFDCDRITLPTIKKTHGFAFVKGGSCSNNKTALFISADAQFLLSIMNSKVTEWIVKMEFPCLGDPWSGGRIEYPAARVKSLPIPPAGAADKSKLTKLAVRAAKAVTAGDNAAVGRIEREIDGIVYRLFALTSDEMAKIESSLAKARRGKADNESDDGDE